MSSTNRSSSKTNYASIKSSAINSRLYFYSTIESCNDSIGSLHVKLLYY